MWINSHCHLGAPEFAADVASVRARAPAVMCCVLPAVRTRDFAALRALAHRLGDAYALGIHPLGMPELCTDAMRRRHQHFYRAQLALAQRFDLPVIVLVNACAALPRLSALLNAAPTVGA